MTADGYTIRTARATEVAALPDIERQAAQAFQGWEERCGFGPGMEIRVNSVEEFERARRDGMLWVAADSDGAPVGFALMLSLGGYAHLEELGVHPDHGRRGLGAALLSAVCDWAADAGYPAVTLSTFRDVPWNAPFYARHGFHVADPETLSPEHVRLVEGEARRGLRVDLRVLMERPLG